MLDEWEFDRIHEFWRRDEAGEPDPDECDPDEKGDRERLEKAENCTQ